METRAMSDPLSGREDQWSGPGRPVASTSDSAIMRSDRAGPTSERKEDVRHPDKAWAEPRYADEPLLKLQEYYLEYLRGRAEPAAADTIRKYGYMLTSFIRSLERNREPTTLGSLTPHNVNRWIAEGRRAGRSEDGLASDLAALKAFSRKYVFKHLELTTVNLLEKVPRITPPEKPFPRLTDTEQERILACLDKPTYADIRDAAIVAVHLATGRRFREVQELCVSDVNLLSGEIQVKAKGGDIQLAYLAPRALKLLRRYLRERPASAPTDRLWLSEDGRPLTYWGYQSVFRRLKRRSGVLRVRSHLLRHHFAQVALEKGAERAAVQEMLGHRTEAMTRRYTASVRQLSAAKLMPKYAPL
jgi:integrase/recombinase XerD